MKNLFLRCTQHCTKTINFASFSSILISLLDSSYRFNDIFKSITGPQQYLSKKLDCQSCSYNWFLLSLLGIGVFHFIYLFKNLIIYFDSLNDLIHCSLIRLTLYVNLIQLLYHIRKSFSLFTTNSR